MRPEILFPLFASSASLKGVGPKLAPLVERLAGPLVRDLAFTLPQALIHRRQTTIADAIDGQVQTFIVRIDAHLPPGKPGLPYRIRVADETGFLFLIYFKVFGDSLLRQHPVGAARAVSGEAKRFNTVELQITHPDWLIDAGKADEIPTVEAVYPATAGLPSRMVRRFALEALAKTPDLPEWVDAGWKAKNAWPGWHAALEAVHHPQSDLDLSPQSAARRRLAYDELLAHQLALAQRKATNRAEPAAVITAGPLADAVEAALPFRLTGAQIRSLAEIRGDLASGERMTRLL
ncbi:MAG: ATP-dependent helicase RecG, partial [Caulobacteraceae bacterium]|nr:ATP-dependent helicase RecG [Caulobacteraceae bacterium]